MNILHLTTHMGGGVGNALSSLAIYEKKHNPKDRHKVILLDDPINYQYIDACKKSSITVRLEREINLIDEIREADITILHWWNHPVMSKYLTIFNKTPSRLVLWSHVNGCNYPCLPFEFLQPIQKTLFTSLFSYENSLWTEPQRLEIRKKSNVIYGLGDFSKLLEGIARKVKKNGKFNIGYIGTISHNKLHPDFVEYCFEVVKKIQNAHFIMVGDPSESSLILAEAKKFKIENRFEFIGYVKNVAEELARFDVFAYPLNPNHYGTTENVMLEAMAFGVPVVALNHNSEKYIINGDEMIGILADDAESYAKSLKKIQQNHFLKKMISKNAKNYIKNNFTIDKNVLNFRSSMADVMRTSKQKINFEEIIGSKPFEWFLSFLGQEREVFLKSLNTEIDSEKIEVETKIKNSSRILREKNKSSIRHFSEVYPDDSNLQYWQRLINE